VITNSTYQAEFKALKRTASRDFEEVLEKEFSKEWASGKRTLTTVWVRGHKGSAGS